MLVEAVLLAKLVQARLQDDVNVAEVTGRSIGAGTGRVVAGAPLGSTTDAEARRLDAMEVRVDLRALV